MKKILLVMLININFVSSMRYPCEWVKIKEKCRNNLGCYEEKLSMNKESILESFVGNVGYCWRLRIKDCGEDLSCYENSYEALIRTAKFSYGIGWDFICLRDYALSELVNMKIKELKN